MPQGDRRRTRTGREPRRGRPGLAAVEVERKFRVHGLFRLPALALPDGGGLGAAELGPC